MHTTEAGQWEIATESEGRYYWSHVLLMKFPKAADWFLCEQDAGINRPLGQSSLFLASSPNQSGWE